MDQPGAPHEALFLVLAYLPLHQLLSMSQVCKSVKDVISSDVLIWLDLVVEKPLNMRLTDEILLRITSKSQGRLRTLALLNCPQITDAGLLRVVKANPLLTKLYVPACTGLTPEGILEVVKILTEQYSSLNSVKINGIYNIKQEHLQLLQRYVSVKVERKPRFSHKYQSSIFSSLDDDSSSIDVEICSRCLEVKLLFDCPRQTCRLRELTSACAGCIYCIPRCEGCGRCSFNEDEELQETICNDTLCLDCWLRCPKCNHCNRPYCPRHADERVTAKPDGFICSICLTKY